MRLRPATRRLPTTEAALETAIQRAMREPGRVGALPECEYAPCPVPLWLHPEPDRSGRSQLTADTRDESFTSRRAAGRSRRRRKAEYVDHREDKNGLLAFRLESLFTWSEFVNVSRSHDDSEDPRAESVADDMDILSLARDRKLSAASALKFDLDLPAPAHDDLMLGEGIALPEWDYKQNRLVDGYCRLQPLAAEDAEPCPLPPRLRRTARTLRGQFEALAPLRMWHKRQSDGEEIDLDAWLEHRTEERLHKPAEQRVYKTFQGRTRDLACLLLADLSFSTDTWVNDQARVIDVIRDGLFVFSEALSAVQDRFALYGFSSRKRDHVRFNILKNFAEPHSDITRGRINAIRPGYYTRMGAPIRQATKILANEPAARQLLLILTDGKPNDLDRYEGRYGVEDTRMAVHAARRAGLYPFCITIDEQAGDYLPYLFGSTGYALVRDPLQLPKKLAGLYWQLTE
jgi:nitric oxide reductase NorD protein